MIVTIDGPAGSGKTSAAKALAQRLGFEVLDTGAMYRAAALAVTRARIPDADQAALEALLAHIDIQTPPGRVLLNGEDVTAAVRTPEISQASSRLAAVPVVRRFLAAQQRAIAQGRDIVCEGRDQGTVVFPDAACKFFFRADREERAIRRLAEHHARGDAQATRESILADQDQRDRRDAERESGPMMPAPDAILIDTTHLAPAQVVDRLELEVRRCWSSSSTQSTA
jgi:cytidylate kinase